MSMILSRDWESELCDESDESMEENEAFLFLHLYPDIVQYPVSCTPADLVITLLFRPR